MAYPEAPGATRDRRGLPLVADGATYRRGDPAEAILQVLSSSANRKGSLVRAGLDSQRTVMLHCIRRHTARLQPVVLTLMAFPFKVPNPAKVGPRCLPDLAEYAALVRLDRLRSAVRGVYEPGLRLQLILDGHALAPIVGIERAEVVAYATYLRALMATSGVADFIELCDLDDLLADSQPDLRSETVRLRRAAREWWLRSKGTRAYVDAFRRTMGMINLRGLPVDETVRLMEAARAGCLPAEHAPLEARVAAAMVEYRLFDLMIHELDPRSRSFPDAIHATTTERPGRLSIWLVRRGRSHLPWHGVGSLDGAGAIRVGPYAQLMAQGGYRPVYRPGEDTPFEYRQAEAASAGGP